MNIFRVAYGHYCGRRFKKCKCRMQFFCVAKHRYGDDMDI